MTLDELRVEIRIICAEAAEPIPGCSFTYGLPKERRDVAHDKIHALFRRYRQQFFQIANVPEPSNDEYWKTPWTPEQHEAYRKGWDGVEKNIKDHDRATYDFMRSKAIAFFTCSCGSREDSCHEDGNGNVSTFVFMPEGDVFRIVEKKA